MILHCHTEPLKVEMLALTGKAVEGDVLTAVEVIPENEIQQLVWNKYKKDVQYQWYSANFLFPSDYFDVYGILPLYSATVLVFEVWICL